MLIFWMAAQAATLEIPVESVDASRSGWLKCALYDSAAGFPKKARKAIGQSRAPSDGPSPTCVFDVPPGQYAVAIIHDEDDNGRMKTGMMGRPLEGWGVTGDFDALMRGPHFEECAVTVGPEGLVTPVRLRY